MEWILISPELIILCTGLLIIISRSSSKQYFEKLSGYICIFGIVLSVVISAVLWNNEKLTLMNAFVVDNYGLALGVAILISTCVVLLATIKGDIGEDEVISGKGEFYALITFACLGMLIMVKGLNLITIILGLEMVSLSSYILAGFDKRNLKSNEAAVKYFLLGLFANALLLYGIAIFYGVVGSTSLVDIHAYYKSIGMKNRLYAFGFAILLVGLGFKVTVYPFNMWVADVYEGSPTLVSAFFSGAVKLAAFAILVRILLGDGVILGNNVLTVVLWIISVSTMTIGNVIAIQQENIKRMLAYSSIAHVGYLIIGFLITENGEYLFALNSIIYYMLAYTFANVGAFLVVSVFEDLGNGCLDVENYAGMGLKYPMLGMSMLLFLISLAGIPPTSGFFAKFYIFSSAVKSGFMGLAVIGIVNCLISVYYYLRVIVKMYMIKPQDFESGYELIASQKGGILAVFLCVLATIFLGVFPGTLLPVIKACIP